MNGIERPRVLILAAAFPPWGGGAVMRMAKLAKYAPECGWDVTVVCSDERDPEIVDWELAAEIPATVRVIRVRGPFNRVGGSATRSVSSALWSGRRRAVATAVTKVGRAILIPDRFLGWAAAVARLPLATLGAHDVILSSGAPHSSHLAAIRLSRRLRIPAVIDLRDDWAGDPFGLNGAPWQPGINRLLEGWCLQRAARTVVVNESMRERLEARHPNLRGRVEAIANGFDPADVDGIPDRRPVPPSAPVRYLYTGRLRDSQRVGVFYETLGRRLGDRPGSVTLELLGHIEPGHVTSAATQLPADALLVREPVPHHEALAVMGSSDVLVVVTDGGGAGPATMTGKIYEYLALRRPILVIGPDGAAPDLVWESGAGAVADPDDAAAMDAALTKVETLARSPAFTGAADDVLQRFDRRALAERWSQLLHRVAELPQQRGSRSTPRPRGQRRPSDVDRHGGRSESTAQD